MRTNGSGVTEVASIRTDMKKFTERHVEIFGIEEKKFCDNCDKRFSFCECNSDGMKELAQETMDQTIVLSLEKGEAGLLRRVLLWLHPQVLSNQIQCAPVEASPEGLEYLKKIMEKLGIA